MTQTFYKIIGHNHKTPAGELYPYRIGLNTLKHVGENFNSKEECGAGGLYFCESKYIFQFVDFGDTLCELQIPEKAPVVPVGQGKFKSCKIIIKRMMPLSDIATVLYVAGRGADLNDVCDFFHRACRKGWLNIIKFFVENGHEYHVRFKLCLVLAVQGNHLECVKYLLQNGAYHFRDQAFKWAAFEGNLEMVKYLVNQGAEITTESCFAIRWAKNNGHFAVVAYLKNLSTASVLNRD